MKIKCNRMALYEALQLASSIVPTRTPKPILQCARIEADQEKELVVVMATDNEITIQYTIPQVEVVEGGCMVVPADRMASILHESKDETIELALTDATCQVMGADSKFRIYGHDPDDYPTIEAVAEDLPVKVQGGVLKRLIHMSTFAAAKENTRYAINGILWEREGKKLRVVATDGRRLAKVEGSAASSGGDGEDSAIVPGKTLQVIERVLTDPDENVQMEFRDNQVVFRTALVQITSTLVQGRFPKYNDVIPASCEKKVKMEAESLRSGVRRVALLTNEQSKGVLLSFSDGELTLTSSTPEAGDAEIHMPVGYQGESFRIGFNPQYILEVLRVIEEPEIDFEMTDENKPGMIKSGKDFLYVLMPVSV